MKLFILNDHVVKEIINSLTIEEKLRDIIFDVIYHYNYSLCDFIYSMFSIYTTYYVNIFDENSYIPYPEAQTICKDISSASKLNIDKDNVFIADIYDILFVKSCYDKIRLNNYFYEDTYNVLANIVGVSQAHEYMDEIFEALENIFCAVEQIIVHDIIHKDELDGNIILYFELTSRNLMIYIFSEF